MHIRIRGACGTVDEQRSRDLPASATCSAPSSRANAPKARPANTSRNAPARQTNHLLLLPPGPERASAFPKLPATKNCICPGLSLCDPGPALSDLVLNTCGVGSSARYFTIRTPPWPGQVLVPSALWALLSTNCFARSCITSQTELHFSLEKTLGMKC